MSQAAVRPRAGLFWLLRPKIRTKLNRARTDEGRVFKGFLLGFVGLFFWGLIFAVIFRMLLYFRGTQGIGDLLAGKLLGLAFLTFLMILVLSNVITALSTFFLSEDLEFVVLAHINKNASSSPPHDHGNSWAVYGQATEYTDMSEYRRLDGNEGDGEAKLEQVKAYRLTPGKAGLYDVRAIHAINYPENARFVRVTGRELELEPRLKFDMSNNKASYIESQGVQ